MAGALVVNPLDKQQISDPNDDGAVSAKRYPALHPRWIDDIRFVTYQAPPTDLTDRGIVEEWADRLKFIQEDLHRLLQMSHQKFWCQAIFDETLHNLLDTYLRFAPRSYDVIYELPGDHRDLHDDVHRLVFFTCLRMATHKESKEAFLTPRVFGEILYENFLFDVPKLFDICILYGEGNSQLLSKMVDNIFTQQPNYTEDLRQTVPTLIQVFDNISEKCGAVDTSRESSPKKIDSPRVDNSALTTMPIATLQDLVFYLADIGMTLSVFVEIYPPAAEVFMEQEFIQRLSSFYEAVFPKIIQAIKSREFEDPSLKRMFYQKMSQTKKSFMKLVHLMLMHCYLQPILENREPVEQHVEGFLELMSSLLNDRRFLADFESCHCFQDYTDILSQSPYDIDETRIHYIQEAFSSAFATFGKRRTPTGATNRGGRTSPDGSPGPMEGATGGFTTSPPAVPQVSIPQGPPTGADRTSTDGSPGPMEGATGGFTTPPPAVVQEPQGACAPSITGIELDSLVTSVQDLLPDLGPGFIELCLEEMDYNIEKVINAVLEDKLPPSLQNMDRNLEREPKPTEDSVISSRANIYDHDEFDIFSRDNVDTSRIYKGKRDKTDKVSLDDFKQLDDMKSRISQTYGMVIDTVETREVDDPSHMSELYDDEYDDTYDANNVGAGDADSADELTSRRPFITPRILGGRVQKSESDESDAEESDEESKPRDEFITNPAILRQRAAERAQARAMRGGQGHKQPGRSQPQGQEGERKYDVKGRARGRGQTDEVLRNRRWKEQHKPSRGRRQAADRKRMGFGAPPPK